MMFFERQKFYSLILLMLISVLVFPTQLVESNNGALVESNFIEKFNVKANMSKVNEITYLPIMGQFGFTSVIDEMNSDETPYFTTFIETETDQIYKIKSKLIKSDQDKWLWQGQFQLNENQITISHLFKIKNLNNVNNSEYFELSVKIYSNSSFSDKLEVYNLIPASNFNKTDNSLLISEPGKNDSVIYNYLAFFNYSSQTDLSSKFLIINKQEQKVIKIGNTIDMIEAKKESVVWKADLISVKAWDITIIDNLIHNLKDANNNIFPELQVYGVTDKTEVEKGDIITYTYFLMNIGMEAANNIQLKVDIPDNAIYLERSSEGDEGLLYLKPVGKKVRIGGESEKELVMNNNVKDLEWKVTDKIEPVMIKKLSFQVKIK